MKVYLFIHCLGKFCCFWLLGRTSGNHGLYSPGGWCRDKSVRKTLCDDRERIRASALSSMEAHRTSIFGVSQSDASAYRRLLESPSQPLEIGTWPHLILREAQGQVTNRLAKGSMIGNRRKSSEYDSRLYSEPENVPRDNTPKPWDLSLNTLLRSEFAR